MDALSGVSRLGVTGLTDGRLDTGFLADLARRASFWWERSPDAIRTLGSEGACLDDWRSVMGGSATALERRLDWQGSATFRLAYSAVGGEACLPQWTSVLRCIAKALTDGDGNEALLDPEARFAFEELLAPAVRAAAGLLRERVEREQPDVDTDLLGLLSPEAHRDLQRALLARLSSIMSEPLYVAFCQVRPYGPMLLGALDAIGGDNVEDTAYREFVASTAADSMRAIFDAYPVVARLAGTAVEQWVESVAELLQRFANDLPLLNDRLLDGLVGFDVATPMIATVEASLSDAHRGGRSVAVLTLADGRRLVYKPKSLALEAALGRLLGWCSEGKQFDLRAAAVLDRGEYGWGEYIEHLPCQDREGARRYYHRAGALLCVLHLLRASDCHHGNLVAHGEYPVLIDAETLCHPRARSLHQDGDIATAGDITQDFLGSVLRTMMLPSWHVSGDGQVAYDISGLGSSASGPLPYSVRDWSWVNTDAMALRERAGEVPAEKNVLRVGDHVVTATDFVPEVVAGFEAMYDHLVRNRAELSGPTGPLAAFADLPIRFLFRGTRIYASILNSACVAEQLTDGARFSIQLDRVSVAFVQGRSRPHAWPVLQGELHALGQLDIPYFQGSVSSDALDAGHGIVIPRYFEASGYADVIATLNSLGDDDRAWQVGLIEGSFLSQVVRHEETEPPDNLERPTPAQRTFERATHPPTHLEMARAVGDELAQRSLMDSRGEAHWLGLGLVAQTERVQLELIGDSLYDGRCGVALFLAALHHVTAEPRWAHLADAALGSVRRLGDELENYAGDPALLPGPAAVGSMVYALVRASAYLEKPEYLDLATRLSAAITQDLIDQDTSYDVLSGAAGATLGLLSLHHATGDSDALTRATACGDHLLAHRLGPEGTRAWTTLGPLPLTGFSHGAAGIALALCRLAEANADPRFGMAAQEAMAYERTLFSAKHGNWPDLRQGDQGAEPSYPNQWCHGATGIALARLGSGAWAHDPQVDDEIRAALTTTMDAGPALVDHLCCGTTGRVEALIVGAAHLDRPDWHQAAERLASHVQQHRISTGMYQLFPNLPRPVFNPGFFRGVSGIGYQWIRMAHPQIPSAILWQ